ncbi:hypothetical protein ACEXAJ_11305 [Fusobacterium necrophorum subsp. funduliforme]
MRARVKRKLLNKKLENIIDSMQIKYPRTNEISSFEVSFQLESPDIISGDTVEVIVQKKAEEFLKIRGKAQVVRHIKDYTGSDTYSITVKDSYDTLFEKQVAETKVYYDLYLCNTGDRDVASDYPEPDTQDRKNLRNRGFVSSLAKKNINQLTVKTRRLGHSESLRKSCKYASYKQALYRKRKCCRD